VVTGTIRLLTASVLIALAAHGARAEESPGLADCKNALQRGDFDGAVPACRAALATATTPEDRAILTVLIDQARSGRVTVRKRRQILDDRMVIDPDDQWRSPFLYERRRPVDESMIINPHF
jgi:hypothetical protein